MEKGRAFYSFEAFEEYLHQYNRENFTYFTKRSSEGMKEKELLHLKYETVVFTCKHGQLRQNSTSTGLRRKPSVKVGCPAKLRLRTRRPPGQEPHLAVTVSELEHQGHDLTPEAWDVLPENRRQHNRDDKIKSICNRIANHLTPLRESEYVRKLAQLETLVELWQPRPSIIMSPSIYLPHQSPTQHSLPHQSPTQHSLPHQSPTQHSLPHQSPTHRSSPHRSPTHQSSPHQSPTYQSPTHQSPSPVSPSSIDCKDVLQLTIAVDPQ